jgi:hypothetical protein
LFPPSPEDLQQTSEEDGSKKDRESAPTSLRDSQSVSLTEPTARVSTTSLTVADMVSMFQEKCSIPLCLTTRRTIPGILLLDIDERDCEFPTLEPHFKQLFGNSRVVVGYIAGRLKSPEEFAILVANFLALFGSFRALLNILVSVAHMRPNIAVRKHDDEVDLRVALGPITSEQVTEYRALLPGCNSGVKLPTRDDQASLVLGMSGDKKKVVLQTPTEGGKDILHPEFATFKSFGAGASLDDIVLWWYLFLFLFHVYFSGVGAVMPKGSKPTSILI